MWPRKKLILIAVVVAVVLAGTLGGIALAQTGTSSDSTGKSLAARVAAILGIDQQKVEDAFKQAEKDMQNEALDNYLKNMVEQGKMTQAEADQYKAWWQSRPDVATEFGLRGPGCFVGRGGFGGWAGPSQQTTQTTQ